MFSFICWICAILNEKKTKRLLYFVPNSTFSFEFCVHFTSLEDISKYVRKNIFFFISSTKKRIISNSLRVTGKEKGLTTQKLTEKVLGTLMKPVRHCEIVLMKQKLLGTSLMSSNNNQKGKNNSREDRNSNWRNRRLRLAHGADSSCFSLSPYE